MEVQSPSRSMIPVRVRRDSGLGTPLRSRPPTPSKENNVKHAASSNKYQQKQSGTADSISRNTSPMRGPILLRVPSREQLQEMRRGRRPSLSTSGDKGKSAELDRQAALEKVKQRFPASNSLAPRLQAKFGLKSKPKSQKSVKHLPYLYNNLQSASIALLADSANLSTMAYCNMLNAGCFSPPAIVDDIYNWDKYYYLWLSVRDLFDLMPQWMKHDCYTNFKHYTKARRLSTTLQGVLRGAYVELIIKLCKGFFDSLEDTSKKPQKPEDNKAMFIPVDTRNLNEKEGINYVYETAMAITAGLEEVGITRKIVFFMIPATENGLAVSKLLKERSIQTNLIFVSGLEHAAACAGASAITFPVDTIVHKHEERRGLDTSKLNPHPGHQEINASAMYMRNKSPETMVLIDTVNNLDDIQNFPCADAICIADWQVEKAKWHKMQLIAEPSPDSIEAKQAAAVASPYVLEGSKFLERMPPNIRRETQSILDIRMRSWARALDSIEELLVNEILYRLDPEAGFIVTIKSFEEIQRNKKLHWLIQTRNLFELCPKQEIPFPVSAASSNFSDVPPVPPTPYLWEDDENTGSSSSDDDDPMELV